jgi:hypothetical protein
LEINALGYPLLANGQAAGTLMMRGSIGAYPKGRYVVTYAGDGELSFNFDAKVALKGDHRIELDVVPTDDGIFLRIERSNRANPIRDIRVWMPGFENAASPFHPTFVNRLRPLEALRFMDWQRTNDSTLAHWSDRTRLTSSNQADRAGVAVEYMVDLANELDVDPWFCMPHLADDNFVRQFATVVKNRLEPGRKIYVEWSNEAWNQQFVQARWAADEALKRYGNRNQAAKVVAEEALRDWEVWHDVFGADADRVVRVAAGWTAVPLFARELTARLQGRFDALAAAAYFDAKGLALSATTSAGQILTQALSNIDATLMPKLQVHQALAADWSAKLGRHVAFVSYEGGQHLSTLGKVEPWQAGFELAQRHSLMYKAYQRLLGGFQAMGGELFVGFNYVSAPSKYGQWGSLTTQTESAANAPKWQALLDAAAGLFGKDATAPIASLAATARPAANAASTTFTVRFVDNVAIDAWDIGHTDVLVKGPGGFQAWATYYTLSKGPGYRPVGATYRLAAPGGSWNAADNGLYSIYLQAGQVTDTSENPVAGGLLGSFFVGL